MKQKCYVFYCEHLKQNIGSGFQCFNCPHFTRPKTIGKKCEHERVLRTYEKEV